MILHISYRKARVYYEDGNERCLEHIWEGRAPEQINLDEYEHSEGE